MVKLCKKSELLKEEQKYLDINPEYNIGTLASGGDNISNHPDKDEIINKISSTLKEKYDNGEIILPKKYGKNNPNWKGGSNTCNSCGKEIKYGPENCIDCYDKSGKNNPFYDKHHTEKTKQILREKRLGTYNGNQEKEVLINGNEYKSLSDAAGDNNMTPGAIHYRLNSDNFPDCKYLSN